MTYTLRAHSYTTDRARRRAPPYPRLVFSPQPARQNTHSRAPPPPQQQYQQRGARLCPRKCVRSTDTHHLGFIAKRVQHAATTKRTHRTNRIAEQQKNNTHASARLHPIVRRRRSPREAPTQHLQGKKAARELSSARAESFACVFGCVCVLAVWREKLLRSMSRVKMCNSRHVVYYTRDLLVQKQNNATATLCPSVRACVCT